MTSSGTRTSSATEDARAVSDVRDAVERYAAGLRDLDVDALKSVFHPDAIMSGDVDRSAFVEPIEGLYGYVRRHEEPAGDSAPFDYVIHSVEIAGETALVTLTERAYLGYDYETSLQLVRSDGAWRIVSKLTSGTAVSTAI
jgi:hypothetical protein